MKTQLLIILAVLLSSLLTVSQRANANEVSQLRWIEPAIEQAFTETSVADQEISSDKDIGQNQSFLPLTFVRKFNLYNSLQDFTPRPYLTLTEARAPPSHNLI
ncbi:hypothetical protein [Marinomonas sp. THO17]|uniref:hypothetical protein n=1 Tax=Marinomonas sp. THO17 TaxID=3149048 RepID=UPI00336C2620